MSDFLLEKYRTNGVSWQQKALIVKLHHDSQKSQNPKWTITNTARYFEISIGLVSENLRLATVLGEDEELWKIETRQKALEIIERRKLLRFRIEDDDDAY